MPGSLFALPVATPLVAGNVLPGARLRFFLTNTSTPANVYEDINLGVAHDIPVEADSGGVFPPIYLSPFITYRVRLTDSADTQIWQYDDVTASAAESQDYRVKHTTPSIIWEETDGSTNNKKFRIVHANEQILFQIGNDAESIWTTVLAIDRSGTTVDSLAISAPVVGNGFSTSGDIATSGELTAADLENGTFTPTWFGFSAPPTGNVTWRKIGPLVILEFGLDNTGTSNDTAMSLTGLPANLRPLTDTTCRVACIVTDNSAETTGGFGFDTPAGKMVFFKFPGGIASFTNPGNKGFPPFARLIYSI